MQEQGELLELYRQIPKKMITFDLTGRCNINCVMCVWHTGVKAQEPKKNLDFDTFKRVVDSLLAAEVKYDCINLSVSGEPTFHPQFKEIMAYLFDHNEDQKLFNFLSLNTNMIPWTPKLIDSTLIHLKKGRGYLFVTCSLNSATRETGIAVKKKDFHDRVEEQMRHLIQRKKDLDLSYHLNLDLQMLVLKENEHEAELFVKKWSKCFEEVGLPYKVVANVFADEDNIINLKREFDNFRQAECDARFITAAKRLGLEGDLVGQFKNPYES